MESGDDVTIQFGGGSLADEVLRDPDAFGARIREQASADADRWYEEELARRLDAARRQRAQGWLGRLVARLGLQHGGHSSDG